MLQKKCPARLKRQSIPRPGGSRRSGLACALFRQETIVRAADEALFEIQTEKSELGSKSVQKIDWIGKSSPKTEWIVENCGLLKTKAKVQNNC